MDKILSFLEKVYGPAADGYRFQSARYRRLADQFSHRFGETPRCYVSVPGRTELGGNHTDHNHGRVLAAAIDLDVVALAAPREDMTVTVFSEGYPSPFVVDLGDLSKREKEERTTAAMIRGVAALLSRSGYLVGGMDVCITSSVMPGWGLSSSAAVEVLLGTLYAVLFNGGEIDSKEIADIGRKAENIYFGKPCGLMDQMACALGGIVAMDFKHSESPKVETLGFDFKVHGIELVIVDTGGDHLDLTDDYADVPAEMRAVAGYFGEKALRDVPLDRLTAAVANLRKAVGDRAVLRALHFMDENIRVYGQVAALREGNIKRFMAYSEASGSSSIRWLQNVYSSRNVHAQGIPLGLAMTERYLSSTGGGVCRVHGGGFAGAIQVLIPRELTDGYVAHIEKVFGPGSAQVFNIRSHGACFLDLQGK